MSQVPAISLDRLDLSKSLERAGYLTTTRILDCLAGQDSPVVQAVSHAVTGGKALRAFLVLESARIHGLAPDVATSAAAGIEAMHAYSLVHDDLPCIDNDNLRRGRPTIHVKWDEATAVLTGDALHSLAYQLVAETEVKATYGLDLTLSLAKAAGLRGMIGGQEQDIAAETADPTLTLAQITALQAGKTGALIRWSAMAGARMVGADTRNLQTYGDCLGLAFQIADDILDVTGDAAKLGKAVGKDARAGKATFVSHLGLEGARKHASDQIEKALAALSTYGKDADTLKEAAWFVLARDS